MLITVIIAIQHILIYTKTETYVFDSILTLDEDNLAYQTVEAVFGDDISVSININVRCSRSSLNKQSIIGTITVDGEPYQVNIERRNPTTFFDILHWDLYYLGSYNQYDNHYNEHLTYNVSDGDRHLSLGINFRNEKIVLVVSETQYFKYSEGSREIILCQYSNDIK